MPDEHAVGEAAVGIVVASLLMQDLEPFVGTRDVLPFDLVVHPGGYRVQVKGVSAARGSGPMPGAYQWSLRKGRGAKSAYAVDDLDVFALVAVDIAKVAYKPMSDLIKPQGVITTVNIKVSDLHLYETFPTDIEPSTEDQ